MGRPFICGSYAALQTVQYSRPNFIIFFTNKETINVREIVAFSLIENLLFWKADGFGVLDLNERDVNETVHDNVHMLDDTYRTEIPECVHSMILK